MFDCAALTDAELDTANRVPADCCPGETSRTEPYQDIGRSGPDRFRLATPQWMRATDDLGHGHGLEPKALALTRRYVRANTNNRTGFSLSISIAMTPCLPGNRPMSPHPMLLL